MIELNTMWKVVLFIAVLKTATAQLTWETRQQWEDFKLQHDKVYNSLDEEDYRMSVFLENLSKIRHHNLLYKMGQTSYYKGVNQFTDLTDEEFNEMYLMPMANEDVDSMKSFCPEATFDSKETRYPDPISLDWRRFGAVSPIRDQKKCGSCYAFSALAALESQVYLTSKNLTTLSVQNIIECSSQRPYKNRRCLFGRPDETFHYVVENNGVDTEQSYPYTSWDGSEPRRCRFDPSHVGATMKRCFQIQVGNETALKMAVAKWGPVSVIADAAGIKQYTGGIYDNPHCNPRPVMGHSMVIIGYGSYRSKEYWLLKSSWGTSWGENGYIMMARNKNNQCGIATTAFIPFVN